MSPLSAKETIFALFVFIITVGNITTAQAFQLTQTIEECIQQSSLVITGMPIRVIKVNESQFDVGKEWEVKLKILKVTKGKTTLSEINVHFSDINVNNGYFDPKRKHNWVLVQYNASNKQPHVFYTGNCVSVFPQ